MECRSYYIVIFLIGFIYFIDIRRRLIKKFGNIFGYLVSIVLDFNDLEL